MLLSFYNGDWRLGKLIHHCVDCVLCRNGETSSREVAMAILITCDVLVSRCPSLPSSKDWGSISHQCARQALGISLHQILPRVLSLVFSKWDALPDPGDGDAAPRHADPEEFRKYLKRKAWRAYKVMVSTSNHIKWCVRSWAVEPLDYLLQRLQHLDHKGGALRVCLSSTRSPFLVCQRRAVLGLRGF